MKESYFEDNGDEFPINSQVRCGQAAFELGFANMTLDDAPARVNTKVPPRSERRRFLPGLRKK